MSNKNYKQTSYKGKGSKKGGYGDKNSSKSSYDVNRSSKRESYDNMCTNDISWYNKQSHLFNNATRVPFNIIPGTPIDLGFGTDVPADGVTLESVPGLMTINYVPGIGISSNSSSAPNRAFQAMYSAILTKTSTSTLPFTAANLACVVIAEQSIAQNIGLAKRILGVANLYASGNYNYPRMLLAGQLQEYTDVMDHIGDYTWKLNNLIRDYNVLRIPNFIDTFKRHYFLANNYFADQDSIAAQLYMFNPLGYYIYNDIGVGVDTLSADGVARACFYSWNDDLHDSRVPNFETLLKVIGVQLEALRSSTDFNIINGSLSRAFADSDFIYVDELALGTRTLPVVDKVMLYQIHNMAPIAAPVRSEGDPRPMGLPADADVDRYVSDSMNIAANYEKNIVRYNPIVSTDGVGVAWRGNYLLNTFESSVDADWIMESTRLTAVLDDTTARTITAIGTEFVTDVSIWFFERTVDSDSNVVERFKDILIQPGGVFINETDYYGAYTMAMLDKFHMAPRYPLALRGETRDVGLGLTGDLDMYTITDKHTITKLHETALLSIFDTSVAEKVRS